MWIYAPKTISPYAPESAGSISASSSPCQNPGAFVMLKKTNSRNRSLWPEWRIKPLILPQSGTISSPSILVRGVGSFLESLRASRVNPYLLRGSGPEKATSGGSSGRLCGWFAEWERGGSSWKTSQGSFLWGSDQYSENWPKAGMIRSGFAYPREPWELPTSGSGGFAWPTPTTQEVVPPNAELTERGRRKTKDGRSSHSVGLADLARLIHKNWPTPQAENFRQRSGERSGEMGLDRMAKWATPSAGLHNDGENPKQWRERWMIHASKPKDQATRAGVPLTIQAVESSPPHQDLPTGSESRPKLNPLFVEMLMGLPPGWTDYDRLEMGLYLSRLRRLFASLCGG